MLKLILNHKIFNGEWIVSSVVLNNLTFEAKSGDELEEVSLGLMSPQMVALCSNSTAPVAALEQLLMNQGK